METVTETPAKNPPPYFAFRTLTNTLDQMKEKAIPTRIDRTFLVGMSGAGQTQFIAGLKGLGLIDASGAVTPKLTNLVNANPAQRKTMIGEIVRETYPEAVALGETNATTGQLVEVFREYGLTGDTARKAIAFYLNAARYSGDVPLSPLFSTPKVTAAPGSRRGKSKTSRNGTGVDGAETPPEDHERGPKMPKLHPAISALLTELPTVGQGWTGQRRAEFMATFQAVVNFTIPIVENGDEDGDEEYDEELS